MQTAGRWLRSAVAVAGVFFLSGILSALVAATLGVWEEPVAGFVAAFCVVRTAFGSAPHYKLTVATVVLLLGAFIAWDVLEPSSYPESYDSAYQPTHLPVLLTLSGGIIGWITAVVLACRTWRND